MDFDGLSHADELTSLSLFAEFTLLGWSGGVVALARHAAAAPLNVRGDTWVDSFFSFAEVVSMVNAALASGDFETTKNEPEETNEAV